MDDDDDDFLPNLGRVTRRREPVVTLGSLHGLFFLSSFLQVARGQCHVMMNG